ncbi:30S ribosomal protein S6, partial [bacterium]|nr:30S ribosomal protein S6 [bacterium]
YKGFYFLINFEMDSDNLPKLNKKLRLTSEILRHMIVKAIIPKPNKERKRKTKEVPKIKSFEDIKNVKI